MRLPPPIQDVAPVPVSNASPEPMPDTIEDRLRAETARLRLEGYPRKIARKMARRACGYAT